MDTGPSTDLFPEGWPNC